jgi:hypothetical protein
MATRKSPISKEHVNAINLVEVEFYDCKKVDASWKIYSEHLNDQNKVEDEVRREEKEKLLAKLLSEIANVLGFRIPAIDIFKGGYAPKGWVHREARALTALEYVNDLYEGQRLVKVMVMPPPPATTGTAAQEGPP